LTYQRSTTSTAPLFEPEAILYDSWYHTQELQCTGHHSSHKPYASGTNYMEVWWKQLSSKFSTVFIFLTCTVHRRHPHPKVREYFIGYALYLEEEEEEEYFTHIVSLI
jgi:hypothetical protein